MNEEQILETIRNLSHSQGTYGRILRDLEEEKKNNPEVYQETMQSLVEQKFKDPVDLIMYIEN